MRKQLMKGNEAIVRSAILAGCRAFYGYPITPASEIAEDAALYMPQAGGVFLQAESEVAAMNMIYGAASAGVRSMSASSGPGISLMQEGISYMAGAELPCVIADITRGGPGLGNIAAEQGDYHQVVKGGGHGNYRTIVLAPHSVQEMADLTALAFELADRYRNPVVVLADGFIGQMMEPVEFPQTAVAPHTPAYAVTGTEETRGNLITSLHLDIDDMEAHQGKMEAKYRQAEEHEVRAEELHTEDAEIVLVGYGIIGRILKAVAAEALVGHRSVTVTCSRSTSRRCPTRVLPPTCRPSSWSPCRLPTARRSSPRTCSRTAEPGEYSLGAGITTSGHHAVVSGPRELTGTVVEAPDLRGGAALAIAGLAAEGTTEVRGLHHIDRGYEDFDAKLGALGADVVRSGGVPV